MSIIFIFISLVCLLAIVTVYWLVSIFITEVEEPIDINLEEEDETN